MGNAERLRSIVHEIVTESPQDFYFPCGEPNPIPLDFESRIADSVSAVGPSLSAADISSLRPLMTFQEAYKLIVVALRLAVLGARTRSAGFLDSSIMVLLMTNGLVDWRDTLRGLSILNDCCGFLEIAMQAKMDQFAHLMNDDLKHTVYHSFFRREPVMQSLAVMGIARKEESEGITYISVV